MCWSLGYGSVHDVLMLIMSIFTWNVILDEEHPQSKPPQLVHSLWKFHDRNIGFAAQWKKKLPNSWATPWFVLQTSRTTDIGMLLDKKWEWHPLLRLAYPWKRHWIIHPPAPLSPERTSSHKNNPMLSCTAKTEQTIQIPNAPSITSRDLSDEQLRCKFLQQGKANPSPRALSLMG